VGTTGRGSFMRLGLQFFVGFVIVEHMANHTIDCKWCGRDIRVMNCDSVHAHEVSCAENPTNKVVLENLMAIGIDSGAERAQSQLSYVIERIGNQTGRIVDLQGAVDNFAQGIFDAAYDHTKDEKIEKQPIAMGSLALLKDAVDHLESQIQELSASIEFLRDQNL